MSVARFVADQRTLYRVPVALTCALLGISVSWFYTWRDRRPTRTQQRRVKVDAAVAAAVAAARGCTARLGCTWTCGMRAGRCRRGRSRTRCAGNAWSRGSSSAATG